MRKVDLPKAAADAGAGAVTVTHEPSCGEKLIGTLLRLAARVSASRNRMLSGFGLTGAQMRLLKTIRRLPIPFTISELARVMKVTRHTARQSVRELEAKGLVRVGQASGDRKARVVFLTTIGEVQLESVRRAEQRWVSVLTRGFDDRTVAQVAWVARIVEERVSD